MIRTNCHGDNGNSGFTLYADEPVRINVTRNPTGPGFIAHVYHGVITMGERRKSIGDGDLRRIIDRVRSGQTAVV